MSGSAIKGLMAGAMLALAGCAAQVPPVQVTRFHLDQPIARGDIAVEPIDKAAADSLEYRVYADAVGRTLGTRGFRLAPDLPRSELVAVVDVRSGTREGMPGRSPVSIGLGGGSFGGGVGLGGGISFPIGKAKSGTLVTTELSVQIKRRSEGTVIWEGRARGEARAGTPYGTPNAMADRLAQALFTGFPGESGRTITVK
ncbi:MAG TPA: DUF4136 domain-containing protein [Sphingomonadaceae bacterium]|nr:DUF4136 domain-containing protein [Sphingomonadaceae bacterium]